MRALGHALSLLALSAFLWSTGCSSLLGNLRRDLDDTEFSEPTVGGRWAGGGFLDEEMSEVGPVADRYVGHSERNPASAGPARGSRSWISAERAAANRRDAYRGMADEAEDGVPNSLKNPVVEPTIKRQYKNGARATRADFLDESQNEGSLWASDGQTNYYFTKNKVRGVGDIISVTVDPDLVRDVGVEARRTLSEREREYELAAAQERLKLKAMGLTTEDGKKDAVATSAAAPSRAPAGDKAAESKPDVEVPQATMTDVDVSKSLELKAGDSMMGEIIERYPNGNYKIRAAKRIPYKGGPARIVNVIGVVKGSDIAEDDTVNSGKLYEYRVEAHR